MNPPAQTTFATDPFYIGFQNAFAFSCDTYQLVSTAEQLRKVEKFFNANRFFIELINPFYYEHILPPGDIRFSDTDAFYNHRLLINVYTVSYVAIEKVRLYLSHPRAPVMTDALPPGPFDEVLDRIAISGSKRPREHEN